MKKFVALLLAMVICLSLCACGGKSNEIELTLENYATYLNISYRYNSEGNAKILNFGDGKLISCTSMESCNMTVSGASPNYDYNNVVITLKVSATYDTYEGFDKTAGVTSTEEVTISCDIGGNGNQSFIIFDDPSCVIDTQSIKIDWEVVAISGIAVRIG